MIMARALAKASIGLAVLSAACASSGGLTPEQLADRLEQKTGYRVRTAGDPGLPPGVSLDDGLTESEAVAIALWNNPDFQGSLADLGIARADIAQAGLLRNPVLTLLLPWGPKQLEATLKWPIEAIWQRPKRLAAARVGAEAVAERLVATGVNLIAATRLAVVDLTAAQARVELAAENVGLSTRVARLAAGRAAAGDISQLEADTAATEAMLAEQDAARATLDVSFARNRLHQLLSVGALVPPSALQPVGEASPSAPCGDLPALQEDALASRPDLRAAELEIEAAGRRLGWERSRIFSFLGVLDANARGSRGFELGPGIETDFGLLDRNQPGVLRAVADLDRAKARYLAVRLQILRELRDAHEQLAAWRTTASAWRSDIRPRLQRQAEQTQRAYEEGELSYLLVIDATRRLNDGRIREADAAADARRALVRLEQSVGRPCTRLPAAGHHE
jgi:cobalt-zinc-cadmium efflux system outer membrane protein